MEVSDKDRQLLLLLAENARTPISLGGWAAAHDRSGAFHAHCWAPPKIHASGFPARGSYLGYLLRSVHSAWMKDKAREVFFGYLCDTVPRWAVFLAAPP